MRPENSCIVVVNTCILTSYSLHGGAWAPLSPADAILLTGANAILYTGFVPQLLT